MSMRVMKEILPAEHFERVHKSFIVAIQKITSMGKNKIKIGEEKIPISNFYKENLSKLTGENHFKILWPCLKIP